MRHQDEQQRRPSSLRELHSPEVVIEPLEGVPNERQAHLGAFVLGGRAGGDGGGGAGGLGGLEQGGVVGLVDLVGGEVGRVDVGGQARLEGGADPAQAVELDAPKEVVALDLMGSASAETVLRVTDEAGGVSLSGLVAHVRGNSQRSSDIPSDQVLSLDTELNIVGEVQRLAPVYNLTVRVMAVLSTEWRPTDQTLEHDSS